MCTTCGCGTDQVTIDGKAHAHGHDHDHAHGHDHDHAHHHHHGAEHSHAAGVGADRAVAVETAILAKNDAEANANRREFTARGILALNLVSSPGSGKTTLLVETIKRLGGDLPIAVIEGDQQTSNDAERIRATGSKAVQVNTGKGCHLDAHMVGHAFEALAPAQDSVLMIENVGNLVCPAAFDLGEAHKVVVLSVTEGEDKPLKYPATFFHADVALITKIDLAEAVEFDRTAAYANLRQVNPNISLLETSAKREIGLDAWLDFLIERRTAKFKG